MGSGIPVRLSAKLAVRARAAAETLDRSLTEQVEHWARLGQVVEEAILSATVQRLKARSHDPELADRLALANTSEGQAKAAKLIRERNHVRYGVEDDGSIRVLRSEKKRASKR
jgi:hypothetical protein